MSDATEDQNRAAVRRLYEECLNRGNMGLLDNLISSDFVGVHGETGAAGFEGTIVALRTAFPDIHYSVDDVIAEGERVAIRWRWTGTHQQAFRGFPASGRAISDTGIAIYELRDGKIIRAWLETNRLGFLQQIGLVSSDEELRARASEAGDVGPDEADLEVD